jgi:hypothetical protein
MAAGDIYTIAGNGTAAYAGDGGPATAAEFNSPQAVTLDGHGNVVIADTANNAVRVVAERTGTFYGVPVTAGHVYTVAGTGKAGFSGDGGPGVSANLDIPWGVAMTGSGGLLISDQENGRIRYLAG